MRYLWWVEFLQSARVSGIHPAFWGTFDGKPFNLIDKKGKLHEIVIIPDDLILGVFDELACP
jgi:hypothetical protein